MVGREEAARPRRSRAQVRGVDADAILERERLQRCSSGSTVSQFVNVTAGSTARASSVASCRAAPRSSSPSASRDCTTSGPAPWCGAPGRHLGGGDGARPKRRPGPRRSRARCRSRERPSRPARGGARAPCTSSTRRRSPSRTRPARVTRSWSSRKSSSGIHTPWMKYSGASVPSCAPRAPRTPLAQDRVHTDEADARSCIRESTVVSWRVALSSAPGGCPGRCRRSRRPAGGDRRRRWMCAVSGGDARPPADRLAGVEAAWAVSSARGMLPRKRSAVGRSTPRSALARR